jgi:hypothetical protein
MKCAHWMRGLLAAWALALPIACGTAPDSATQASGAGEGGAGDGAGSSSGSSSGGDDGPAADGTGNDSPAGDTGAIEAGGDSGQPCPSDPAPPPTVASVGAVTFVVTNASTADRYVVTQGQGCDAFVIGGEQLSLPFQCGCECAPPQPSFTMTTVAAGQSVKLTWDGRHLVTYTTHMTCCPNGSPASCNFPVTCATSTGGSAQPVPAGPLVVSIAYATQVPTNAFPVSCTPTTGAFQCRVMSGPGPSQQCGVGAPGGGLAMQTFTLPASGGVTVPVSIP